MAPTRRVKVVLPSCSPSITVFNISSGQAPLNGARVTLPASSENELTKSIRSGATISR
jgi:hypothetical protein